ncbi:MAG: cell envelope integrity protein TolA [Pseudomonadota bacterium]
MDATLTRDPFMPQAPRVRGRAITLAVLAHLLLVLALAFGVNWRSDEPASVAAELWSATPQAAAPRAVEPPPPPPEPTPVQKTEPVVQPPPKPPEPVSAKPPTPTLPDPQIAIEKAKKEEARRIAEQEEARREKREKAEREKQELALKKEKEREKAEKLKADQAKADKLKAEQAKAELAKKEKAEKDQAAREAAIRDQNLKRITGMAGATGGSNDTGTALRSSAPSANYAGRVMARIKPNILLTDPVDGNPRAVVEVKLAPDGTIIAKRLVQSSGTKVWDDAVLRAIERTEMLPLDNGRAPPVFEIGFRPRD